MKSACVSLILWALLAGNLLSARTLSFPAQNFECEVDDAWTIRHATGSSIDAVDPSGNNFSISTRLDDVALSLDSPAFLQGMNQWVETRGYKVDQRGEIKMRGERFLEWRISSARPDKEREGVLRFILADGYVYLIGFSSRDDPSLHSDLTAMADSFRFINPPHIHESLGLDDSRGRGAQGDYNDSLDQPDSNFPFLFRLCAFAFFPIIGIAGAIWALKQNEKPRSFTKGKS